MTLEAAAAHTEPLAPEVAAARPPHIEERIASVALALLPGALVVYFSFEGGGYFAGSVAFVALVLVQLLILRVLFAEHPFAGISRGHAAVVAIFAGYTGWTLASALWSHALGRALVEFDRSLLYLLLLLLFGCAPRRDWRIPLIVRGLAAGSLFVCTVSLITRVLPHVWPIAPGVANNRLSYPLTYWNALGILAGISVLLLLGIAARPREPVFSRALAAAGVPIAASTLLLTLSRGAIASLVIGLAVFLIAGRSAGLLGTLVATVPTTAYALLTTYHANLLVSSNTTSSAALAQGQRVAVAVALMGATAAVIRLGVVPLERRLAREELGQKVPRRTRRWALAGVLCMAIAAAIAAGGPSWVSRQYRGFIRGAAVQQANPRARLLDPSSNGRTEHWRVALKAFSTAPIRGTGAGTFEFSWYRYRNTAGAGVVVDTHSLYLQTLSELGLVGALLLVTTLIAVLVALVRGRRGPDRVLYSALLCAALAWACHAAVDWDWQMPAVTAWLFAVGGTALAGETNELRPSHAIARVPIAALFLVLITTPGLMMLSQAHLSSAASAFEQGSCAAAQRDALSSINVLSARPQPYQILGYCDISDGRYSDAVAAMRHAVNAEPASWEYRYGLSIAEAYAGIDPRPALRSAEQLNLGDALEVYLAPVLRTRSPARWLAAARLAYTNIFASGRLSLR